MKACAYYRVSSKKQQERESIETQRAEMRPWFKKRGHKDVTEFVDDGISGEEISKRPAFSEMLSRMGEGEFGALLVFQVDRIGRFKDRADRNRAMELIINSKILVDTLYDGKFDPKSEDDMDELEKLLTEARRENRRRAKKIVAGQRRARMAGRFASGRIPYGIDWDKEEGWRINEIEYRTLKELHRLLCSGYGLTKTCQILNADPDKYPTRSQRKAKEGKEGSPWVSATVHGIFHNDFYFTGKLVQNRMNKQGGPKPKDEWIEIDTGINLFTEEEVRECRHHMSRRRVRKNREEVPKDDFLLQGLAACSECGANLGILATKPPDSKKVFRYYI